MGSFRLATTTAVRQRQMISRRLYGRTKMTRSLGGNYTTITNYQGRAYEDLRIHHFPKFSRIEQFRNK